jgi:hypothetical protein
VGATVQGPRSDRVTGLCVGLESMTENKDARNGYGDYHLLSEVAACRYERVTRKVQL